MVVRKIFGKSCLTNEHSNLFYNINMGGEIEDRLRGAVAGDSVCSLCEDM